MTAVSHPLEALSILEQRDENEKSYDVVLSDVHMPDMDGFKLMRRVNKEFNLPVVCKFFCTLINVHSLVRIENNCFL